MQSQTAVEVFTLFQVTKAAEHDMNEGGLNYILELAKKNKLNAIAMRYIAVVPAASSVKIKAPISWRNKLGIFAMRIENYSFN